MRRCISLALVLAASVVASTDASLESKEPSNASPQCRAHAWVRAPDMVPGDVIAGDVKIKLSGPCPDAESYALGLRYKERIFWKLRREDAPIPKIPEFTHDWTESNRDLFRVPLPFQNVGNLDYNETEWKVYQNSVQNKALWSVHEEERVAFEIKTPLFGAEGADPLSKSLTTQFGILVPNTNYPPGLDYHQNGIYFGGDTDTFSSESIYEYFVEIRFSNGTTSEVPAGMTTFTPFSTEKESPSVNTYLVHAGRGSNMKPLELSLRSNYTIEVSFPNGVHVYQSVFNRTGYLIACFLDSSVNITATVHRTGYTNRTDAPVELCAFPSGSSTIEWYPQELKNRSQPFTPFVKALISSAVPFMGFGFSPFAVPFMGFGFSPSAVPFMGCGVSHTVSPCREIKFASPPADLIHEGHITSTSSEPLSLSIHVDHYAVPDFSTYYHKLGHRVNLGLHVKLDPSEPWEYEFEKKQWEKHTEEMDENDFDWVPWSSSKQARHRYLTGDTSLSVMPMQKQRLAQSTPVHYLSDEARQPTFVKLSDIADLRQMSPEQRDFIAPFAQPSIKVFAKGEELTNRYFTDMQRPIYVGDTWAKKVLSVAAEGQHQRDAMDRLLVVQ
ncbi:hypothetical protein DFH29DRAFT_562124 [Suillus ampliporus]|nr:hypothetical protein DFH29DRAFT_562124 [Suillus ampliporus]